MQEDGGWQTNIDQMSKSAYARVSMLTKLRYAGVSRADLLTIYKMFIRSKLEYCVVPMHGSLSSQQEATLERVQSVSLRIILQEDYNSYSEALETTGLEKLTTRREERCLQFAKKMSQPSNQ